MHTENGADVTDTTDDDHGVDLAMTLGDAWSTVERILTGNLGAVRGISFSEYRLLSALDAVGERGSSRADLGRAVGLTPSAVTRALQPLAKLGMVTTTKDARDARRALARLTPAGAEVVADATGVVRDAMAMVGEGAPRTREHRSLLLDLLTELANA